MGASSAGSGEIPWTTSSAEFLKTHLPVVIHDHYSIRMMITTEFSQTTFKITLNILTTYKILSYVTISAPLGTVSINPLQDLYLLAICSALQKALLGESLEWTIHLETFSYTN